MVRLRRFRESPFGFLQSKSPSLRSTNRPEYTTLPNLTQKVFYTGSGLGVLDTYSGINLRHKNSTFTQVLELYPRRTVYGNILFLLTLNSVWVSFSGALLSPSLTSLLPVSDPTVFVSLWFVVIFDVLRSFLRGELGGLCHVGMAVTKT